MNTPSLTVVKVAARNWQVHDNGNPVTDHEGTVLRFKTQGAAQAEVDASKADDAADDAAQAAPVSPPEPADTPTPPVEADTPAVDVAALTRADRLTMAGNESKAVKAWKAAGSEGPRPATPAMDYMADPSAPKGKVPKVTTPKAARPTRDPAVDAAYAVMPCTERLAAYKAELIMLREWEAAGSVGEPPAHPATVWHRNPNGHYPPRESGPRIVRTDEQEAQLDAIVAAGVAAGTSWARIAEDLIIAGVPTSTPVGIWTGTSVRLRAERKTVAA